MSATPTEILWKALVDSEVVTNPEGLGLWPCYFNHLPAATDPASSPGSAFVIPDNAVCVYTTPGATDGRVMKTGVVYEHPGIMVRLRCFDAIAGEQKMQSIVQMLDSFRRVEVEIDPNMYLLHVFARRSGILSGGQSLSDQRNSTFSVNGRIAVSLVD